MLFLHGHSSFGAPGCSKQARLAMCSASVSYLFIISLCNDSIRVRPTAAKSPVAIFAKFAVLVGPTTVAAVDDQPEIILSIPQGTLPRQPIPVGFIHKIHRIHGVK